MDTGSSRPALVVALETIVAPLVEADGGELYLLPMASPGRPADKPGEGSGVPPTQGGQTASGEGSVIRLHLAGKFSGCPGNALVTEHVIRPALAPISPSAAVEISSGRLIPPGAERVHAKPKTET